MQIVKVGIGVFVLRKGKILMGCRKGAHGENTWSVPGGHLEFGEDIEGAAFREVKEETNVSIKSIRFGAITNDKFEAENKHYVTIWMLSNWESGKAKITEPDKFIDIGWFTFDDLPQPLFLPWKQLINSEFYKGIKGEAEKS